MSIRERLSTLWSHVRHAERESPTRLRIPSDHVDRPPSADASAVSGAASDGERLTKDEHYFQVRVNELFLVNQRDWFTDFDPVVVANTEFLYERASVALPVVVGPSLIRDAKTVPKGMIFTDTSVAGPHPYRGGPLKLTVILGKVVREDHARKLLGFVESATKIFDYATALGSYMKVATLILDGVEGLLGTGGDRMLIGLRTEIDPDAGDELAAGYHVLIDASDVKAEHLWVRGHQLHYGRTEEGAEPFRDANYVLYSITRATDRTDTVKLPFYQQYEQSIGLAMQSSTDEQWKLAKASLATLAQTLRLSSDLTAPQADRLRELYKNEMLKERQKAVDISALSEAIELDPQVREASKILDL
jgi:hypothetical protein